MLVNVKGRVGGGENLGPASRPVSLSVSAISTPNSLVDVVYADSLQDLSLDDVSNPRLGHDLLVTTRVSAKERSDDEGSSRESRRPP